MRFFFHKHAQPCQRYRPSTHAQALIYCRWREMRSRCRTSNAYRVLQMKYPLPLRRTKSSPRSACNCACVLSFARGKDEASSRFRPRSLCASPEKLQCACSMHFTAHTTRPNVLKNERHDGGVCFVRCGDTAYTMFHWCVSFLRLLSGVGGTACFLDVLCARRCA